MRFERKYKINGVPFEAIEMIVHQHPALFEKAYPDRWVNNVYFDSNDLHFFRDNVDGVNRRSKVRIRWYGDSMTTIDQPRLEIKKKQNELGTKDVMELEDLDFDLEVLSEAIKDSLPGHHDLSPTLVNKYLRSYYENEDGRFRLTIDRKLTYFHPSSSTVLDMKAIDDDVVIEIKYDADYDNEADHIFQAIPFRPTKSSKYVSGLFLTHFD